MACVVFTELNRILPVATHVIRRRGWWNVGETYDGEREPESLAQMLLKKS